MMTIFAQAQATSSQSSILIIGAVVIGLTAILNMVVAGKQLIGGNKGERQIEPTQLHAITSELRQQTVMLHGLGTESAATKASVESVKARVDELRADQRKDMDGVHTRIGGISRELAATTAKVEIALKHVGTS